jgi:hypothetical protein
MVVASKINPDDYSTTAIYEDLHRVNQLLWLYNLSIKHGQLKSPNGEIDYVEYRDKMLETRHKILVILARRGEITDVQLCE